ncbi:MAG TPA: class II aldolase/adducin family protein [Deinococcales bacterium]|nr:class II aldolase/adducin family protein [Deinococcales bacterium]
MSAAEGAAALLAACRQMFERGYTSSTGGNASQRTPAGFLVSATGTSFGRLAPGDLVECDLAGLPLRQGPAPSKEASFHAAIYRRRPDVRVVMHLHSAAAIALSTLAEPTLDGNCLPVVTSYAATRVGRTPLLPYSPPGSQALAEAVAESCGEVNAILMQNHGLVTLGGTLDESVDIFEEFEQAAKVWLATLGQARVLDDAELALARPKPGTAVAPGTQRPRLRAGVRFGPGEP